jgi:hypothetical protein
MLTKKALGISRGNKRLGLMVSAQKWKTRADWFASQVRWAENLITDESAEAAVLEGGGDDISLGSSQGTRATVKTTNQLKKRPEDRKAGELWEATDEEKDARRQRERLMKREDLIEEAVLWEERFEPLLKKAMWVNVETNEVTFELPKSVAMRNEQQEELEKKQKEFLEAQRRLTMQRATTKTGKKRL